MSWLPKKTVVVPIDFSTNSEQAARTALEMVETPAAVHLLHVLYPLDAVSPGVVWGEVDDRKREQAVRKHFEPFISKVGAEGARVEVRFGHPGLEITEYADAVGADLIVIPSHGRHGVKRFVLGSIAERVVRHATCPVLVLRRTEDE